MATRDEAYWSSVYDSQNYQIEQLEQERDQLKEECVALKARVAELEEAIGMYLEFPDTALGPAISVAREVLNRTPAQSLEERQRRDREVAARAISEFIKDPNKWPDWKRNYKLTANSAGGEKG